MTHAAPEARPVENHRSGLSCLIMIVILSHVFSVFPGSGDRSQGPWPAAGWHGNVRQRRLLCGSAAAHAGGRHRAGHHQAPTRGHLEVGPHRATPGPHRATPGPPGPPQAPTEPPSPPGPPRPPQSHDRSPQFTLHPAPTLCVCVLLH